MKLPTATKLAILLAVLGCFYAYREHKRVQQKELRAALTPSLIAPLPPGLPSMAVYEGKLTELWKDRPYRTSMDVPRLMGMHFVRPARNDTGVVLFKVMAPTRIYTIGYAKQLASTKGWTPEKDEVEVVDVVEERSMDLLLGRDYRPGAYIIRYRNGGPAQPVFFDPAKVQVISLGAGRTSEVARQPMVGEAHAEP